MKPIIAGIDAGGTSTKIELFDLELNPLRTKTFSGMQLSVMDEMVASKLLTHCLQISLEADESLHLLGFSAAGLGNEAKRLRLCETLKLDLHIPFSLMTDAESAFYSLFEHEWGCMLINGTGSVVAVGEFGNLQFYGGFGPVLGDDASGLAIGISALRAWALSIQHHEFTPLRKNLEQYFGKKDRSSLIQLVYREALEPASLAPFVLSSAEHGCESAREILTSHLRDFSLIVQHALTRFSHLDAIPIGFHGGLYQSVYFRQEMTTTLKTIDPRIQILTKIARPCLAAAKLAKIAFKSC